ncbi:MAG: hypothetical protein HYR64_03685 [Fimbriimonas ginsengisoli]|uniref:Uncharacterized protein n=1 Tax=Fimbriimonas ginsengisoli TaxID=1005039 RepID=A0A931LWL2_FIMGI|nr:hypothetical protein [Fimbriimonas ginsengisoli]
MNSKPSSISGPSDVLYRGKVFELGDYPDLGFGIDAAEMDAAISAFGAVPNDLEHSRLRSVLGHSLGELRRLWRVGQEVYGELAIPSWLAELIGNVMKVSLAFDRHKRVVGSALTLHPRISDAQVVAAFSRLTSRVAPSATHGLNSFGSLVPIHRDSLADPLRDAVLGVASGGPRVSPHSHAKPSQSNRKAIAERANGAPEIRYDGEASASREETMHRFLKERLAAAFGLGGPPAALAQPENWTGAPNAVGPEPPDPPDDEADEPDTQDEAAQAELKMLRERAVALAVGRAEASAAQFADESVRGRKFLPVDRPYLVRLFLGALLADGGGEVRFSEEGHPHEGPCCQALREMAERRPPHDWTGEVLLSATPVKFASQAGITEERKSELLARSDLGREAARMRGASNGRLSAH